MNDEEMLLKLKATLLEDQAQQINFPFQAIRCLVDENEQYIMFG
jgi:hypothetical protein